MLLLSYAVIWQMNLYLRSQLKQINGLPGIWSSCLEPLSLWQIARIMLKAADMLKDKEWRKLHKKL